LRNIEGAVIKGVRRRRNQRRDVGHEPDDEQ
jgi:hypothetical protein